MTLLAVLSLQHALVTREPLLGEDLLSSLQRQAAVWMIDFRILAAVRNGKADLVMNEALNEIFLPRTNDLAVDLAVVRLRPKVLRVGRMSTRL